jgi:hypothetical protein
MGCGSRRRHRWRPDDRRIPLDYKARPRPRAGSISVRQSLLRAAYNRGVGLIVRDDEYPAWVRAYDGFSDAVLTLTVLGFGIAYLVMGNTGGRIIGAVLTTTALAFVTVWIRRHFADPS